MKELQDIFEDEIALRPFESWLLEERTGNFAYIRPLPAYELPKAEKQAVQCIIDEELTGFPKF